MMNTSANSTIAKAVTARPGKLFYLDGLRGVAALMVVFWHFSATFMPFLNARSLFPKTGLVHFAVNYGLAVFYSGNFAVCIFFVLSGYVLTQGFFKTGIGAELGRKAIGRYVRLAPPIFVGSLICAVLIYFDLYSNSMVHQIVGSGDADYKLNRSILALNPSGFLNEVLFRDFLVNDDAHLFNPAFWTMEIEFRGSMLVFMVAVLVYRIAGALALAPVRWGVFKETFLFLTINLLGLLLVLTTHVRGLYFWNMLIGVAFAAWGPVRALPRLVWIPFLGLALFLGGDNGGSAYTHLNPVLNLICPGNGVQVAHVIGASLLLFVILGNDALQALFSKAVCRFLGRVSFPLYIIHGPIIYALACGLFLKLYGQVPFALLVVGLFVLTVSSALVAADLLSRLVDEPAVKWSRKFGRWGVARFFPSKPVTSSC